MNKPLTLNVLILLRVSRISKKKEAEFYVKKYGLPQEAYNLIYERTKY